MSQLTISWSALRAHEECKQRTALRGKKSPTSNIRMFFHGTVVDRVMRQWLEDEHRQPGEMVEMVRDILNREELDAMATGDGIVRWKDAGDREETITWCEELVRRLEPHLMEIVVPKEFEPARRFRVPLEIELPNGRPMGIYLAGEMDILTRDEHNVFDVWDLKGTANETYWKKTIGQLVFYDLATFASFGSYTGVTGLIQPMCVQQVIRFTVTDQHRQEMLARISRMANDILAKNFTPNEANTYCTRCFVRHACPKFKPIPGSGRMNLLDLHRAETVASADLLIGDQDG